MSSGLGQDPSPAWVTPGSPGSVSASSGLWVSVLVSPGPSCTPGTEPDALKICPDLGKAWPGKKPQGFVPVQVDQTLQEQGMQRVCPGAVRKDRRSPTPLCWTPFQGSALFPPPRKSGMERWAWGQRLCCPAGLAWGRSHLRASDRCSSTASEPFDASQDTGNWGLGPLKSVTP